MKAYKGEFLLDLYYSIIIAVEFIIYRNLRGRNVSRITPFLYKFELLICYQQKMYRGKSFARMTEFLNYKNLFPRVSYRVYNLIVLAPINFEHNTLSSISNI